VTRKVKQVLRRDSCCTIVPNGRTIAHPDFVFIVRWSDPNAALARFSE